MEGKDEFFNLDDRFVYSEITKHIIQEHTLISNRMGWLLSANAFLFAPVVIVLNNGVNSDNQRILLQAIFGLGILLVLVFAVPIYLAVHTIDILRKRYKIFLEKVTDKEYYLIDPEQTLRNQSLEDLLERRLRYAHDISMICQLLIPLIILCGWVWLFYNVNL